MKKNIIGETLLSVTIGVLIFSIILIALYKILDYNNALNTDFYALNNIHILEQNATHIINKIDTSLLSEGDVFFLHQTSTGVNIKIGEDFQEYRYIDAKGEWVENLLLPIQIYTRFCIVERDTIEGQSIKCSIKELIRK